MPRVLRYTIVLSVGALLASEIGTPTVAEERRDPFERPRVITPEPKIIPRLVGVVTGSKLPLAVIGEAVATIGDTVGGWVVVEIQAESIVVEQGQRRVEVGIGELLPEE
jgi:hypothetical protein